MKTKEKSVKSEQEKAKLISDSDNFSSKSDLSCKKHPSSSSSVGICASCLTEKLIKLVCSDCGEKRMSSCSCCSDFCSIRNSSSTFDTQSIGSVGRISVLIENDKNEPKTLFSHLQLKQSETGDETGDGVMFKRSNSCVFEVKKSKGFWKIGRLFKKKREKIDCSEKNRGIDVSRSRSLSSFMGDKFHHEMCSVACSSSKISDFEGGFAVKDSNFSGIDDFDDDDEFIDLKIELTNKSKTEHSVFKKCDKLMVDDREIKKMKNSNKKAWKWMFKHHSMRNDHNHILKS